MLVMASLYRQNKAARLHPFFQATSNCFPSIHKRTTKCAGHYIGCSSSLFGSYHHASNLSSNHQYFGTVVVVFTRSGRRTCIYKRQGCQRDISNRMTSPTIFPFPYLTSQFSGTLDSSQRFAFHTNQIRARIPSNRHGNVNHKMNDDSYTAFLNRANEVPVQTMSENDRFKLKTLDQDVEIPEGIREATRDTYYISESDEAFVPIALKVEGGMPDKASFAKLVNHPQPEDAEIHIMRTDQWDPHGQYKELIQAVEMAVDENNIRVYQIVLSVTKSEYWLVGLKDGVLLGAKAMAIES